MGLRLASRILVTANNFPTELPDISHKKSKRRLDLEKTCFILLDVKGDVRRVPLFQVETLLFFLYPHLGYMCHFIQWACTINHSANTFIQHMQLSIPNETDKLGTDSFLRMRGDCDMTKVSVMCYDTVACVGLWI